MPAAGRREPRESPALLAPGGRPPGLGAPPGRGIRGGDEARGRELVRRGPSERSLERGGPPRGHGARANRARLGTRRGRRGVLVLPGAPAGVGPHGPGAALPGRPLGRPGGRARARDTHAGDVPPRVRAHRGGSGGGAGAFRRCARARAARDPCPGAGDRRRGAHPGGPAAALGAGGGPPRGAGPGGVGAGGAANGGGGEPRLREGPGSRGSSAPCPPHLLGAPLRRRRPAAPRPGPRRRHPRGAGTRRVPPLLRAGSARGGGRGTGRAGAVHRRVLGAEGRRAVGQLGAGRGAGVRRARRRGPPSTRAGRHPPLRPSDGTGCRGPGCARRLARRLGRGRGAGVESGGRRDAHRALR